MFLGATKGEIFKQHIIGTSLAVQWLRLHASIAADAGSNPGQEAKIASALQSKTQNIKQAML